LSRRFSPVYAALATLTSQKNVAWGWAQAQLKLPLHTRRSELSRFIFIGFDVVARCFEQPDT